MRRLVCLVLLGAASLSVHAQAPRAADLVAWTVGTQAATRGATGRVVLRARIAPGWRLYAMDSPVGRPLTLDVEALPRGIEAASPRQSRPRQGFDAAFGEAYPYFADAVEVVLPLRVARRAAPGRHTITGTVRYALCDDAICLPPAAIPFRTTLVVR